LNFLNHKHGFKVIYDNVLLLSDKGLEKFFNEIIKEEIKVSVTFDGNWSKSLAALYQRASNISTMPAPNGSEEGWTWCKETIFS